MCSADQLPMLILSISECWIKTAPVPTAWSSPPSRTAVNLKNTYNVRVINSLARSADLRKLRDWIRYVKPPKPPGAMASWWWLRRAVTWDATAIPTVLSPGNSPHAITVGATGRRVDTYTRNDDLDRQL